MPWAVTVAGRTVRLDDLPVDLVADVARQADVSWFDLVMVAPAKDLRAARMLVDAIASHLQVESAGVMTVRQLLDCFAQVEDDMPAVFEDGLPKAGDG